MLDQAESDLAYLEDVWDKCDHGKLDRGISAFHTQAALELFGEKKDQIKDKASGLGIQIVAELEPDWQSSLGLALICLRDIRAVRHVHTGYTFPLPFIHHRHLQIQDEAAIMDDYMLARFMMDLNVEMVDLQAHYKHLKTQ